MEKLKSGIYTIKIFVGMGPKLSDDPDHLAQEESTWETKRVMKNLALINLAAFFFYFGLNSSFHARRYIFDMGTLGAWTAVIANGTRVIATIIIGRQIRKWPLNKVILIGTLLHGPEVVAGFFPTWYTMVPSAIISGIGNAGLGIATCVSIASLGKYYEQNKPKADPYRIQTRIFLLYNVAQQSSVVASYYATFGILGTRLPQEMVNDHRLAICGYDYCNQNLHLAKYKDVAGAVASSRIYWMGAVSLASVLLVSGPLLWFLEPLKDTSKPPLALKRPEKSSEKTADDEGDGDETISHIKNRLQFLLIPSNILTAIGSSFWFLDVTKAYITCASGIQYLIETLLTYAIAFILAAFFFGWFVQKTARGQLLVGLSLKIGLPLALLFFKPGINTWTMMLLVTAFWAISDGVLAPGILALYEELFPDILTTAFTYQQFWTALGFFLVDLFSVTMCMNSKLYMNTILAVIAIVQYLGLEVIIRAIK